MLTCLFFVVAAIIEFAVVLHLKVRSEQNEMHDKVVSSKKLFASLKEEHKIAGTLIETDKLLSLVDDAIKGERSKFINQAHKIDYLVLLVFGLLFFDFNGIYWMYYLLY